MASRMLIASFQIFVIMNKQCETPNKPLVTQVTENKCNTGKQTHSEITTVKVSNMKQITRCPANDTLPHVLFKRDWNETFFHFQRSAACFASLI